MLGTVVYRLRCVQSKAGYFVYMFCWFFPVFWVCSLWAYSAVAAVGFLIHLYIYNVGYGIYN